MTRFGRRLGWRDRHRKTLQQARDDCTLFPIRWLELESNSNRLCTQPSQSITAFIRRHQRLSHTGLWHFTDNHRHRGQGNGIDRAFAQKTFSRLLAGTSGPHPDIGDVADSEAQSRMLLAAAHAKQSIGLSPAMQEPD